MGTQYGEDKIIDWLLKDIKDGLYVDIGAGNPEEFSNTYALYQRGWRGLLVEPSHDYVKMLQEQRPRDAIFQGAILDYNGDVEFSTRNGAMGVVDKSNIYYDYKTEVYNHIQSGEDVNKHIFKVQCYTMNKLFTTYPNYLHPDFLSIDIEGTEEFALKGVDFSQFTPKVICIEWTLRGQDMTPKWEHYLLPYYNFYCKTMGNAFYVRKLEGLNLVSPTSVELAKTSDLTVAEVILTTLDTPPIDEIYRVLKPKGRVTVVYDKGFYKGLLERFKVEKTYIKNEIIVVLTKGEIYDLLENKS